MHDKDQLIISLNGKDKFDIAFEDAYLNQTSLTSREDFFNSWHPCYRLNFETITNQDYMIGHSLEMYG